MSNPAYDALISELKWLEDSMDSVERMSKESDADSPYKHNFRCGYRLAIRQMKNRIEVLRKKELGG